MKLSVVSAVALWAAAVTARVRLPFTRQSHPLSSNPRRRDDERRSTSTVDFFSADTVYLVNVTVGTPPQNMSMMLTVQAGETWVVNANNCDEDGYSLKYGWCKYGSFMPNESSTYVNPGTETFMTSYTEGYAYGEIMSETLSIGDVHLGKLNMGVVDTADTYIGVLALGFNTSAYTPSPYSSSSSNTSSESLPTVPDRLLTDGMINSTAYSLWVDDLSTESGSLLLGAVDRSKFDGPLTRFPIVTSFSTSKVFNTRIHSINGSKSSSDVLEPLGSLGTSYNDKPIVRISPHNIASWLPEDIAQDIYAIAGATWLESQSNYVVPCSANTSTAQLSIQLHGFDGPVLKVPISDLVIPADFWSSSKWSWDTETATQYCLFGVQSDNSSTSSTSTTSGSSSSTYSLGGMMLKRAYMVFDLANEEIAIAKTNFGGGTTEDVIPFPSYAAEVPGSTSVSVVVSVYCPVGATSDECDPNGSGSGDGYDYYDSVGLSRGAKIGIGVGVGGFSLIVMALTVWAVMRCRRIRRAEAELVEKQKRAEEGTGAAAETGVDKDLNPAMSPKSPVAVKETTSMSESAQDVTTTGNVEGNKVGPSRP
ncbi:putative aspartic-type endopeptidase OPSB [Colletotrichum siamense]|uniref:Aspartic-type endopeptidase OPSB n=1 Tax=Colletotrichum siamense TaxID=690259 RepID=A0A9P5ECJ1_COLSI|nr:putative aspartic-type endopeptidase OPSB [Colletotrichum siamense]KAF4840560.1 putative aspartic-type endopeptidase OPSB [Colletotrichum siamense]